MNRVVSPRLWLAAILILAGTCGVQAKRPTLPYRPIALASTPANEASGWSGETGVASYYGRAQNSSVTASGAPFNEEALTAAHPWLPFGTRVRVTLPRTGRSVVVTINDRLPSSRRIVDLSVGAARTLGMIHQGIATVSLSPV